MIKVPRSRSGTIGRSCGLLRIPLMHDAVHRQASVRMVDSAVLKQEPLARSVMMTSLGGVPSRDQGLMVITCVCLACADQASAVGDGVGTEEAGLARAELEAAGSQTAVVWAAVGCGWWLPRAWT